VFLPDTIFKFKKIENCKLFFSDLEKMDIKESLNSDGKQFHQYQQNVQPPPPSGTDDIWHIF
jgi:hypothetical protein